MLSTISQLRALFSASDMQSVVGKPFAVYTDHIWDIGSNITYPCLAFAVDTNDNLPPSIADREAGVLRIWFYAQSRTDCERMRDAIWTKLHKQHVSLTRSGVLSVQYLAQTHSHVGKPPNIGQYAAYCTYDIIV